MLARWPNYPQYVGSLRLHFFARYLTHDTVSDILAARYSAKPTAEEQAKVSLEKALDDFRSRVPLVLRYEGIDPGSGRGLWPAMLTMAYK